MINTDGANIRKEFEQRTLILQNRLSFCKMRVNLSRNPKNIRFSPTKLEASHTKLEARRAVCGVELSRISVSSLSRKCRHGQ